MRQWRQSRIREWHLVVLACLVFAIMPPLDYSTENLSASPQQFSVLDPDDEEDGSAGSPGPFVISAPLTWTFAAGDCSPLAYSAPSSVPPQLALLSILRC